MKVLLKILIYASIAALLFYLYGLDYSSFKDIEFDYFNVVISLFFLILGFLFSAFSWQVTLKLHGIPISARQAIVSQGLPVFTKYIPGRIWSIVGRAALVKNKDNSMKRLSFISFKEQLIYLCLGFFISIYPVLQTEKIKEYSLVIISLTCLLFLILFFKRIQAWFETIWNKIFKTEINVPKITIKEFFILSMVVVIVWVLWIIAFYYLLVSFLDTTPFYFAFAFPLSIVLGLVSIIFPGGIGVREGVITLFLISNGVAAEIAILVSVVARVWFLTAEVFIFILALILKRKD